MAHEQISAEPETEDRPQPAGVRAAGPGSVRHAGLSALHSPGNAGPCGAAVPAVGPGAAAGGAVEPEVFQSIL